MDRQSGFSGEFWARVGDVPLETEEELVKRASTCGWYVCQVFVVAFVFGAPG